MCLFPGCVDTAAPPAADDADDPFDAVGPSNSSMDKDDDVSLLSSSSPHSGSTSFESIVRLKVA